MKLSNFQMIEIIPYHPIVRLEQIAPRGEGITRFTTEYARATVDVTTRFLFWSRTRKRTIVRAGKLWHFEDGTHTPGFQAESLEREWLAKNPVISSALVSKTQQSHS
jgi:hypothetical protein